MEHPGLSNMVFNMIQRADIDVRPALYKRIVLSGGTTMYPGFATRLQHDLQQLYKTHVLAGDEGRFQSKVRHSVLLTSAVSHTCRPLQKKAIKVEDPPSRKHLVYVGAAVLADVMKDKAQFWISKQEYEEEGQRVVEKYTGAAV